MKPRSVKSFVVTALIFVLIVQSWLPRGAAGAKIDCGPVANKSSDFPRTVAIGTNPAGTGAHSFGAGLAAVGSTATSMSVRVQPYNGPNAWMPLLQNGELEFGIINILDAYMAQTGTGNYEKPSPSLRVVSGGVFPFTIAMVAREKSNIKTYSDFRGKRLAWDYGGHAISQTWQSAMLETVGLKASDVIQVRVSNTADGIRAVGEGRADGSQTGIGIAVIEEINAMEPVRFPTMPNTDAAKAVLARYGATIVKSEPATGIKGDTYVVGYPLHLVSSTNVNERTVYTLVKAWWDNIAEIQTKHPLLKRWTKETQALTQFTVPYHPGAVKFYKELGVWTEKHESRTREICS
jgi:TRAP transporter TAXI family solute receptor